MNLIYIYIQDFIELYFSEFYASKRIDKLIDVDPRPTIDHQSWILRESLITLCLKKKKDSQRYL